MTSIYNYKEEKPHRVKRILWILVSNTICRLLVGGKLRYVRNLILRAFGAKLPLHVSVYPSANIFAPWNLVMHPYSTIGPRVNIYNKALVTIGASAVVSQDATICTASHDIADPHHALVTAPVTIKDMAWVAAEAFVGMGVTVEQGAVVGARAAVFKDVPAWTVVGGNPAKFLKKRIISNE